MQEVYEARVATVREVATRPESSGAERWIFGFLERSVSTGTLEYDLRLVEEDGGGWALTFSPRNGGEPVVLNIRNR